MKKQHRHQFVDMKKILQRKSPHNKGIDLFFSVKILFLISYVHLIEMSESNIITMLHPVI